MHHTVALCIRKVASHALEMDIYNTEVLESFCLCTLFINNQLSKTAFIVFSCGLMVVVMTKMPVLMQMCCFYTVSLIRHRVDFTFTLCFCVYFCLVLWFFCHALSPNPVCCHSHLLSPPLVSLFCFPALYIPVGVCLSLSVAFVTLKMPVCSLFCSAYVLFIY